MTVSEQDPRRHSLLTRFAFDRDGRLRGWRMLGIAAAGGLVMAIGTMIAAALAGTGNPAALSIWAIVAFLAVKLPLLGLLWWLLGRPEPDDIDQLDAERAGAILERLRTASRQAMRSPDAWDRLDVLVEEARFLELHAPHPMREDAAALARELVAARDEHRPVTTGA